MDNLRRENSIPLVWNIGKFLVQEVVLTAANEDEEKMKPIPLVIALPEKPIRIILVASGGYQKILFITQEYKAAKAY